MNALFVFALLVVCASAFQMAPFRNVVSRTSLQMNVPGGQPTSPGKNLKPMFDGTFKEAGAHLEQYVLEHENGARAIVDTKTATCISWIDQNGVQVIGGKETVHSFPTLGAKLGGHFVPEERAKKVSFDRMIFKNNEAGIADVEYRCDVTMRADSLEYDITIINTSASTHDLQFGLNFNIAADAAAKGSKVVAMKGFTEKTDNSVATPKWTVPVGKFKEHNFHVKIDSTKK